MIYHVIVCWAALHNCVLDQDAYSGPSYDDARNAMNELVSVLEEDSRVTGIEYDSPSLHIARARAVTDDGVLGTVYMTM